MKSPYKAKWLTSLFNHLDSCLTYGTYGTYGLPGFPPSGVTVLPGVLALRNKMNELGQLEKRQVRWCMNGSMQIQGLDYEESYAPTVM